MDSSWKTWLKNSLKSSDEEDQSIDKYLQETPTGGKKQTGMFEKAIS